MPWIERTETGRAGLERFTTSPATGAIAATLLACVVAKEKLMKPPLLCPVMKTRSSSISSSSSTRSIISARKIESSVGLPLQAPCQLVGRPRADGKATTKPSFSESSFQP